MITIIDYGTGNLNSIKNMYRRLGIESQISSNVNDIQNANKLILPGVGAFDYGMQQLNTSGLTDIIREKVMKHKTPILGICLGVQLLTQSSEEGKLPGLGFINGKTVAFDKTKLSAAQKIPGMGWRHVTNNNSSRLFLNMYDEPRFYFVHSYHLLLDNKEDVLAETEYGYTFTAGIEKENILGVQFHPEKSHKYGMRLLENFAKNY